MTVRRRRAHARITPPAAGWLAWLVALVLVLSVGAAQAQTDTPESPGDTEAAASPAETETARPPLDRRATVETLTDRWQPTLDRIQAYARGGELDTERSERYRRALATIQAEASAARDSIQGEISSLERRLAALKGPSEEDSPQSPALRKEISQYNEELADARNRLAAAQLALTRYDELSLALAKLLRDDIVSRLSRRGPSPLDYTTWLHASQDVIKRTDELVASPARWWRALPDSRRSVATLIAGGFFATLILGAGYVLKRVLLRIGGRDPAVTRPGYIRRLLAAVSETLARGLIPATVLSLLTAVLLTVADIEEPLLRAVLISLYQGGMLMLLMLPLAQALLVPNAPEWRLSYHTSDMARALLWRIRFLLLVLATGTGLHGFLYQLGSDAYISQDVGAIVIALLSGFAMVGFIALMQRHVWFVAVDDSDADSEFISEEELAVLGDTGDRRFNLVETLWNIVRWVMIGMAVAGFVAGLIGYTALCQHIFRALFGSVGAITLIYLTRGLLRDAIIALCDSKATRVQLNLAERTSHRLKTFAFGLLDLSAFVIAALTIVSIWGVPFEEVAFWTSQAFLGFTIGTVTLSPIDLFAAVAAFVLVLGITRLLQRALTLRTAGSDVDPGVAQSLAAGLGFVGILIAGVVAIGAMGISLAQLAIVAGALSVGIGFGLQNIVNNFVSGIILLIERPIKIGDWVVVGQHEGFVKQISIRATEIQTWQMASVIVPNADILSQAVHNWTHRDKLGRIEIPVRIAVDTDPARVRDMLVEIARLHPRVISRRGPYEPYVVFMAFGEYDIKLELRCFTNEVTWVLFIASDIRFEIDKRFREEGIEVPFPQRVLRMPDGAPAYPDRPVPGDLSNTHIGHPHRLR